MAVTTITKNGAFTQDVANEINANFSSLSASTAGGTLTDAHVLVGNGANVATDVAVSGDVTLANTGAVTVTGIHGTAVSAIPITDQEDGVTVWNDSGVLKVSTSA